MANVGSAYVTLMPSMRGFATKVNAEFGSAGKSSGASFSKGFDAGGGSAKGFSGKMRVLLVRLVALQALLLILHCLLFLLSAAK